MQPVSVFILQNCFCCLSVSPFNAGCDRSSLKLSLYKGCVRCPIPQPPNMHEKMYSPCIALSFQHYPITIGKQCSAVILPLIFFLIALNTFQILILDYNIEFD